MTKHQLFIILSLFCASILFLSCDDKTNPLVGTWDYTDRTISNCMDSNNNETFDYTGDGYCEMLNNMTSCSQFSLVMTEEKYTIHETTTLDGTETVSVLETGTYKQFDATDSNIQFCTDLLCKSKNYFISNGRLTLESIDFNTDCVVNITASKR